MQAYLPVSLFSILCLELFYSAFSQNPSRSLPYTCAFVILKMSPLPYTPYKLNLYFEALLKYHVLYGAVVIFSH